MSDFNQHAGWGNRRSVQLCERIRFIDWVKKILKYRERIIANNPEDWASFLKNSGIKTLWLHYVSSQNPAFKYRYTAGFVGGGGSWLIEAIYENNSDY